MTPKSNPTLTREQNKLMKLMGGVDRDRALAKGFRYKVEGDGNHISWLYGSTLLLSIPRSYTSLLTLEKLENIKIIHKVCDEVRVSVFGNTIYTEEGQFDLDNIQVSSSIRGESLEKHINSLYREEYCWKTKEGDYIPFKELSNFHLANIIGKVPSKIPKGIILETKRRFGNVIINEATVAFAGCCDRGIKAFEEKYCLEEKGWCSLSFLIDRLSFNPEKIGLVIKKAILKEL